MILLRFIEILIGSILSGIGLSMLPVIAKARGNRLPGYASASVVLGAGLALLGFGLVG